jgi:hypothetical protein
MDVQFHLDGQVIHIFCESEDDAKKVMMIFYKILVGSGYGEELGHVGTRKDGTEERTGIFKNEILPN